MGQTFKMRLHGEKRINRKDRGTKFKRNFKVLEVLECNLSALLSLDSSFSINKYICGWISH